MTGPGQVAMGRLPLGKKVGERALVRGLNILFLASTLPRFTDDQQAPFVLEQAQAWKRKRPNDRITILAPHDPVAARRETIGNVEIQRFQYFAPARWQALAYPAILPNLKRNPLLVFQLLPFLWAEYAAAKRIVLEDRIDLIYAHWVMPQGVVASWLCKTTGAPYVIQNHSSDVSVFNRAGSIGRSVARAIIRGAQQMFCVNSRQKIDALELFAASARSEVDDKIIVLPMGVGMDVSEIRPIEDGGASSQYALGAISRLSRKKGIDLLIAAAEKLAEKGRVVSVGIAGDGEDRIALTEMPRRATIRFLGFLSGAEKIRFFNSTRFMVFPSVSAGADVEGMPVALLEALCCGKVVIAGPDTNVTMLAEWDRISHCVILLGDPRNIEEFSSAIEQLLELDQTTLAARSKNLRKVMSRYLWDNLIEEYLVAISPEQLAGQDASRDRKSATNSSY